MGALGGRRESASKLTDNNCQLLRVLIKLLEASREPRTLAVACHDLGEFATHYPAGRFLVRGRRVAGLLPHSHTRIQPHTTHPHALRTSHHPPHTHTKKKEKKKKEKKKKASDCV